MCELASGTLSMKALLGDSFLCFWGKDIIKARVKMYSLVCLSFPRTREQGKYPSTKRRMEPPVSLLAGIGIIWKDLF